MGLQVERTSGNGVKVYKRRKADICGGIPNVHDVFGAASAEIGDEARKRIKE